MPYSWNSHDSFSFAFFGGIGFPISAHSLIPLSRSSKASSKVLDIFAAGKIAKALKRTVGATRQKAFSLGVSLNSRPESRAAPASPCRNGGTRPAAPPIPEISAYPRTTDRGPGGLYGRTNPSARDRSTRTPFF